MYKAHNCWKRHVNAIQTSEAFLNQRLEVISIETPSVQVPE